MSRLRVHTFSVSIDGFGAGPKQDLEHPLGVGGPELVDWFFHTRTFQRMHGSGEGDPGVDDDVSARGFENIGAWILGRNMFGPVRGPWPDDNWRGWWGRRLPNLLRGGHGKLKIELITLVGHERFSGVDVGRERAHLNAAVFPNVK